MNAQIFVYSCTPCFMLKVRYQLLPSQNGSVCVKQVAWSLWRHIHLRGFEYAPKDILNLCLWVRCWNHDVGGPSACNKRHRHCNESRMYLGHVQYGFHFPIEEHIFFKK